MTRERSETTVRVHVYVRNLRIRIGAIMYVVCMYTYVSSIRHSDNMNSGS